MSHSIIILIFSVLGAGFNMAALIGKKRKKLTLDDALNLIIYIALIVFAIISLVNHEPF